jgi:hypothetical protein
MPGGLCLPVARTEPPRLDLEGPRLTITKTALAQNPDVTIRKLDGLNHLFQTARTGAIGEYADIEETIAPIVLGIVTEWIEARFNRRLSLAVVLQ